MSTIDFRYITDVVTPEEAIAMLERNETTKEQRISELNETGYPAYTTQVGTYNDIAISIKQIIIINIPDRMDEIHRCQSSKTLSKISWPRIYGV